MDTASFIAADWPAPPGIVAGTTTRIGGQSPQPRDSFDLGAGGPDAADVVDVAANRQRLTTGLDLAYEPAWLRQVHGAVVADADQPVHEPADAAVATRAEHSCAVLTADCLPVLLCDRRGSCWSAVHAGWRGIAAGVLPAAVSAMPAPPDELLAWLGPAIGPAAFEVGPDVRAAIMARDRGGEVAFHASGDRYYADIFAIARRQLRLIGVESVYGGGRCTFSDTQMFYSHRRDAGPGRMASVIGWRTAAV